MAAETQARALPVLDPGEQLNGPSWLPGGWRAEVSQEMLEIRS